MPAKRSKALTSAIYVRVSDDFLKRLDAVLDEGETGAQLARRFLLTEVVRRENLVRQRQRDAATASADRDLGIMTGRAELELRPLAPREPK